MSRLTTLVFALSFVVLVLAQNNCELHENEPVVLGDAEHFSVLAGAAITNSGASEVIGDVGVSPGTAVTGFGPDVMKHHSSIELASSDGASGKIDLAVAYNDAASRDACPIAKIGELGGMTLTPGLYKSTSGMAVSTDLILDADGDEEAVWIFQMASTFVSAVSAKIVLQNGANARNIFWQVGSSGTIGAYSTFEGTMMAHASITLGAGAVVNGRVLARTAAVTMISNNITRPMPQGNDSMDWHVPSHSSHAVWN
mmetsp:Transcript_39550/g.28578  ORF Transcript_39550/g.28578 Transcript_39550/m.28578 type:complete len:255 (-) Transcript_39550:157-921(-)